MSAHLTAAEASEWEEIYYFDGPESRPVMTMPPRVKATSKFIQDVTHGLGLHAVEAERVADWCIDKMERFGASRAEPVFDMEGNGPVCSWCKALWPLCGHQYMSVTIAEDGDVTE